MTRPSRAGWVRFPHSPATIAALIVALPLSSIQSQIPDSVLGKSPGAAVLCEKPARDAGPAPTVPKVVIAGTVERPLPKCRVPISPRAALIRSLALPGWGQFNLDRRKAGWIFVGTEAGALVMVAKSKHDLDQATAARRDTIATLVTDPLGNPVIDPATGMQKIESQPKNKNLADRVKARRTHLEDWVAAIVFNHLFSGADAWVAANLADFDANVKVTSTGRRGVTVAARVAW